MEFGAGGGEARGRSPAEFVCQTVLANVRSSEGADAGLRLLARQTERRSTRSWFLAAASRDATIYEVREDEVDALVG